MKVVQINSTCGKGSTGKICIGISQLALAYEIKNKIIYFSGNSSYEYSEKLSNKMYIKIQGLKSRILGNYGFNSNLTTIKLIKKLELYQPDIVHIHNIHSHDINLKKLCDYLNMKHIKVIYTFHDCWAFTGYCPHFIMNNCNNWKTNCYSCPFYHDYSWLFDKAHKNCNKKMDALLHLDLTIVTPSQWLASLVKESFLKMCSVKVINNGIDLNVFKPTPSSFRNINNLEGKYILLGVADAWGKRKGLDVFVELSKKLPKNYAIVLVGITHNLEKKLPKNIISINKTHNQIELSEIYTAADLFVNPTREDNYPTVNMESLACGTPVLTFRTGGSPEIIDYSCGSVVDCDNIEDLEKEIVRICETRPYSKDNCLKKAATFDLENRFKEYIDLYQKIYAK